MYVAADAIYIYVAAAAICIYVAAAAIICVRGWLLAHLRVHAGLDSDSLDLCEGAIIYYACCCSCYVYVRGLAACTPARTCWPGRR
jgi:hypothetical protein